MTATRQAPRTVADPAPEKTERGLRFRLHDVTPERSPLPTLRCDRALATKVKSELEACSDPLRQVLADIEAQPLILGAYKAYAEHRPLVISPDAVWLTILQGFAHHIHADPERYRDRLVLHQGRKRIEIKVNDHRWDSPDNDWPDRFQRLAAATAADARGQIDRWAVVPFSTSGPIELAAFRVAMLDVLRPYYAYVVRVVCGIPAIELTGSADDWRSIADRISFLEDFDLGWWTRALKPIASAFIDAAEGRIDLGHWSQIIKRNRSYGGERLDGWLVHLIPYIKGNTSRIDHPNPLLSVASPNDAGSLIGNGVLPEDLPGGLSQLPFTLSSPRRSRSMEMIAGLVGLTQSENGALEPQIGWAIRRRPGITCVLDIMESRGDLRPPVAGLDFFTHQFLPEEFSEIRARCDGGLFRTRSGEVIGRLFSAKERRMVQRDGDRLSTRPSRDKNAIQVSEAFKSPQEPKWFCFAELDGRVLAFDLMRHQRKEPQVVYALPETLNIDSAEDFKIPVPFGDFILSAFERD